MTTTSNEISVAGSTVEYLAPELASPSPQRYRHYKGGIYELICEATHETDMSPVIVYRAPDGSIWTRMHEVFFQMIEVNGVTVQRFTPI